MQCSIDDDGLRGLIEQCFGGSAQGVMHGVWNAQLKPTLEKLLFVELAILSPEPWHIRAAASHAVSWLQALILRGQPRQRIDYLAMLIGIGSASLLSLNGLTAFRSAWDELFGGDPNMPTEDEDLVFDTLAVLFATLYSVERCCSTYLRFRFANAVQSSEVLDFEEVARACPGFSKSDCRSRLRKHVKQALGLSAVARHTM
jgi:hypothetical protein